jgi:hypothetical protein
MIDRGPYGNSQLSRFNVWPTLEAFYRADERRRESPQADFPGLGERWKDRAGWRWIVFFMPSTGEFVAQQVDHGRHMATDNDRGPIVLLGAIPLFPRSIPSIPRLWSTLESSHDRFVLAEPSIDLAFVILRDAKSLTDDPDFMDAIALRIDVATRLLAALFRNPESELYDIPLSEMNTRIARGEVYVGSV